MDKFYSASRDYGFDTIMLRKYDIPFDRWVKENEVFLESSYDECINGSEWKINITFEEWCLLSYKHRKYSHYSPEEKKWD